MLTKTKNIRKKTKKKFFQKMKKMSGRMDHRTQPPKFERNLCARFRENLATDGRTDDGQTPHTMSSADRVKQS